MEIIDPRKTPFVPVRSRGELPHLYKPGGTYFITFRLADAIVPADERTKPSREARGRPVSDEVELVRAFDPPIALGSCALNDDRLARLVENAMLHFHKERYD